MTLSAQWQKIKDNWLLILIPLLLLLFFSGSLNMLGSISDYSSYGSYGEMASAPAAYASKSSIYQPETGFAPEIKQRLIAKTSTLTAEVEEFSSAETQLKAIIKSSEAYVLNENTELHGSGRFQYRTGSFEIKVESGKYDAFVQQLKGIGKVKTFSENAEDITDIHSDASITLDGEKERLKRYEAMYAEAKEIKDKIELNDRIFNQQNTIKYLEERLKNLDQQVSYSTIRVSLEEKQSSFAGIELIGLGELAKGFVGSVSSLFALIVAIVPWVIAIYFVLWLSRKIKGKRK